MRYLQSTIGGSGRRARERRMAVIREDQQEEIKAPRVESLRDRVPFSARGTLPPRELPRLQLDPELYS
jgi:hypothetical protein